MKAEDFFKQKKGIMVDAAFKHGGRYTAVDVCRFANEYHEVKSSEMFSAEHMKDFAAKCMLLGHQNKNLGELLKDYIDNDL